MSSQIYSRQYLQGLPAAHRRQMLDNDVFRLFQQILQPLQAAALRGETRYLHDMTQWMEQQINSHSRITPKEARFNQQMQAYQQTLVAPSDELLAGLKEKFPDCDVSFQEDWVETRQGVRELKKGILIDWS